MAELENGARRAIRWLRIELAYILRFSLPYPATEILLTAALAKKGR